MRTTQIDCMRIVLATMVASALLFISPVVTRAQNATQTTIQSANSPHGSCSLTMGWEPWEPYQFIDKNSKLTGFDIDLVSTIFESIGCEISFKQINWARGIIEVRTGQLDLLPHADFTEERAEWAHFSDSYRDASQVLYVKEGQSGKFRFNSLEDIINSNFRLGVGRGVFSGDRFAELMEDPEFKKHIYYLPTDEIQQYRILQAGRIDGYIRSITALDSLRDKLGDSLDLEIHPLHILTSRQHFIFSQNSVDKSLVEKFNTALKSIVSSGVYRDLKQKFLK